MKTTLNNNDRGFTIIEVVLVLAIAGLIFLIVFLALPQLQASRRDTQRKNDAGRLVAGLENWAGNHSGNYPTAVNQAWVDTNIAGDFGDPDGGNYNFVTTYAGVVNEGDVFYAYDGTNGQMCIGTADGVQNGNGPREVAVVMQLENGQYCQDNQ